MKSKPNKLAIAAVTGLASLTALTVGAFGFTQVVNAESPSSGNIFSRVASILNVDETKLSDAFKTAHIEEVQAKVDEGDITQEQADEMISRIENSENGYGYMGKGMMGGGMRGEKGFGMGNNTDLAEFLGIEVTDLQTAHQNGETLLQIATENGKSEAELKAFLRANEEERLTEAVESGRLTEDQKTTILENFDSNIDERINSTEPYRMGGMGKLGARGGF